MSAASTPPVIPAPRADGYTTSTPVPLYWAVYGPADAPRLLVLHGGPGAHHDYLLPQMLELADSYELVFYDQRGGGRSRTDAHEPITWETQVRDLGLVARELCGDHVTLVGYSWGGLLALLYAAARAGATAVHLPPEAPDVARMVLIDPAPITRDLRRTFEQELAGRQASQRITAERTALAKSGLRDRDADAYRQRAFELSVAGYFADPARARALTPFRIIGRVQESIWSSLGDFDLTTAAAAVRAPTLVVHGREDPIPLAASEALVAAMPDATLVVLDGSGHVPYVEAPAELFAAVRRFLAEPAAAT